ncbi:MAG: hypothetical protein M3416_05300 [Acidobacteriota bacterium]|nr:hypothetical protein [Acidobacteriota bacterium]
MNLETNNTEAHNLVRAALADIDNYKKSKELEHLRAAEGKLRDARHRDPRYMRAVFYGAVVSDLVGKPKDAAEQFEQLLRQESPYATEIRYNLAVAYYHRYSHRWLKKADEHFNAVIRNTSNLVLQLLAHAGLAQTHAMWIIQPDPRNPDEAAARAHFEESRRQYDIVAARLEFLQTLDPAAYNEIKWTVLNARGMSLMYYTDYFDELDEKLRKLDEALGHLLEADRYSPKNWANYCDIGSGHMRLGYWLLTDYPYDEPPPADFWLLGPEEAYRYLAELAGESRGYAARMVGHFNESAKHLTEVVETLRPRYGFALYELGRLARLTGNVERAIEYFDAALSIEEDYRDVGDKTVNREKARAAAGDTSFP